MTPIFYGLKRSYHASLRLSHQALRPFGITPARFDMLRCIEKLYDGFQFQIGEALGIRPSTTSRMLKALIEMELVVKAPFEEFGRAHMVSLTQKGEALLKQIDQALFGSGMANLTQQVAASWSSSERRAARLTRRFDKHLRWVRFALGDTSIRFRDDRNWGDHRFREKLIRRPIALLGDRERWRDELFSLGE